MSKSDEIRACIKDMLEWFHNFCTENNIRYYALGGTLLGAVRHKGFIPWDDDADLGLPRPDFDRLVELMKAEKGRYRLESPADGADDFFYPFAKLYDTETTAIDDGKYKTKRGIFLDIFPIDGIGNTEREVSRNFRRFDLKFNFFVSRTCDIRKGRSKIKNMIIFVSNRIPGFIVDDKKLLAGICRECRRYDYEASAFCGNLVGAYHRREIVPKEYFGTPTPMPFEDITINCVENADGYLTHIYGDWHKIPDEADRKGHHGFVSVDTHKGYVE